MDSIIQTVFKKGLKQPLAYTIVNRFALRPAGLASYSPGPAQRWPGNPNEIKTESSMDGIVKKVSQSLNFAISCLQQNVFLAVTKTFEEENLEYLVDSMPVEVCMNVRSYRC